MPRASKQSLTYQIIYGEICQGKEALKKGWGNWLTGLGDCAGGWDWWVSLTFRDRRPESTWTKPGWAFTNRAWDRWMMELAQLQFERVEIGEIPAREPVSWVKGCRELQKGRGVDHFHALLAGVGELPRKAAWKWWFDKYGIARIVPHNRNLGAGYYLCKYVTKELGDIQFSDSFALDKNRF